MISAAIFRDGQVIERPALDASMPQRADSAFIWIEAIDPADGDFAVLQQRFGLHSVAVNDAMGAAHGDDALKYSILYGLGFYVLSALIYLAASRRLKRDWHRA